MKSLVCTAVACWVFSFVAKAQGQSDTVPLFPDHYRARTALFKREAIANDKIVFLGDGFIESGNWKKILKDSSVVNRGIRGDIAFSLLLRTGEVISRHPAKVFIMIGADDLFKKLPDESIIETIFSVSKKIRRALPDGRIFVQSILPVNPSAKNFPSGRDKDEHATVINAQLQKYAARLGYTYVDLYSEFLDNKGHLSPAYSSDGFNLNTAGYSHWIEALKSKKYL